MDRNNEFLSLYNKHKSQELELAHITKEENLKLILNSKSLLARPTWDFNDDQEYILGLNLILAALKNLDDKNYEDIKRGLDKCSSSFMPPLPLTSFSTKEVKLVFLYIIQNIEFEIRHSANPQVKIYTTSLISLKSATRNNTKKMIRDYGNCIIHFNSILSLLAYSNPKPLTSSMISRVTYNEYEFKMFIKNFFNFNPNFLLSDKVLWVIFSLPDPEWRLKSLCDWVTERLCLFASNIKSTNYSYENEWRIKSVISNFSELKLAGQNYLYHDPSFSELGMPSYLAFDSRFDPVRLVRKFTIKDEKDTNKTRFIVDKITIHSDDKELKLWVKEWEIDNAIPSSFEFNKLLLNLNEQAK